MVKKLMFIFLAVSIVLLFVSIASSMNREHDQESLSASLDMSEYGINGEKGCLIPEDVMEIEFSKISRSDYHTKQYNPSISGLNPEVIDGIVQGYTIDGNQPSWELAPTKLKKIILEGIQVSDLTSKVYTNHLGKYIINPVSPFGYLMSVPNREDISVIDYSPNSSFPIVPYDFVGGVKSYNLTYGEESFNFPQINVYHHTQEAREWLNWDADHIYALTNSWPICNAFAYLDEGYIVFGEEAKTGPYHCPNTAYSTIIVHEYGHQLLQQYHPWPLCPTYGPCEFGDPYSYHEGIGDTFAILTLGDACVGHDFHGPGTGCLRDADEDWIFPVESGPHDRGRPISGSFWDLRKSLMEEYGGEEGNEILANLFFYMVKENYEGLHENLTEIVLEADEFHYQGKHRELIIEAFTRHGFSER